MILFFHRAFANVRPAALGVPGFAGFPLQRLPHRADASLHPARRLVALTDALFALFLVVLRFVRFLVVFFARVFAAFLAARERADFLRALVFAAFLAAALRLAAVELEDFFFAFFLVVFFLVVFFLRRRLAATSLAVARFCAAVRGFFRFVVAIFFLPLMTLTLYATGYLRMKVRAPGTSPSYP